MDRKAAIVDFIKNNIMHNRNASLDENEDLLGSGVLDSLAILQLVSFVEKQFNIQIPDEDVVYEHFMSINALVNYLQKFP